MRTSSRSDIDAFIVMDVMEAARKAEAAGRHIIHMEVGQPSTGAPEGARQAVARALEAGPLGYTVGLGLPDLRTKIAARYQQWYGLDLDPARVIVTSGASGAFILAFTALFDRGDKVGLGLPGYPSYRQILRALDLTPVGIQTEQDHRFQPQPHDITSDLSGLILASPGNPAGTMLDHTRLSALVDAAQQQGVSVVSDEIYHGLSYGPRAVSALEVSDDIYVINSFSKYFSMTGWRVGWMVVPPDHVRVVERLAQNMFICPCHASQVAALAAMECDAELAQNVETYAANREVMIAGLKAAGLTRFAPPDGAFYVYADISDLSDDALALSRQMLDEVGIAVTPGLDFDPERGHHFLRFSYAASTEDIREGMVRLAKFTQARGL